MAPPTNKLRLSQIDPSQLARDVEDAIAHNLHRLAFVMAPRFEISIRDTERVSPTVALDPGEGPPPPAPSFTQIGQSVRDLALYARGLTGIDAPVQEYLITFLDALVPPLGDAQDAAGLDGVLSGEDDVDLLAPDSVLDRLALVVCAALGRETIESGRAVRASWLAALAEVSSDHVRLLARRGELERDDDGEVLAKSASSWLAGRKVAGFVARLPPPHARRVRVGLVPVRRLLVQRRRDARLVVPRGDVHLAAERRVVGDEDHDLAALEHGVAEVVGGDVAGHIMILPSGCGSSWSW